MEKRKQGVGGSNLIRRGVCEKEQVIFDDGVGKSMAIKIGKMKRIL